jgi:LemA protein
MELIILIVSLAAAVGFYIMFTYNDFVGLRVRIEEAWSDIEVQMKRRYDLVPNLVETVKGYAGHEARTLENVTRARAEAMANHGAPSDQARTENLLTGALKSLFALSESYPELKANEGFLSLQRDLAEVEEHIQASRRYYNGTVRRNNIKVHRFPSNLVANAFKFGTAEFFELGEDEDAARKPVAVSFE